MRIRFGFVSVVPAVIGAWVGLADAIASECKPPHDIGLTILSAIPLDAPAFTQGLLYLSGKLYEGTGQYGRSAVRSIDLTTGKTQVLATLPRSVFGEGLDHWDGRFAQLTWKERSVFVWHGLPGSRPITKRYPRDGWGLTHTSSSWVASDGTSTLYLLDKTSFRTKSQINVKRGSEPQARLNELEFAEGRILANIFETDEIARIDPRSGCVDGIIDLSPLRSKLTPSQAGKIDGDSGAVFNGIAYSGAGSTYFISGKNWPVIFKIRLHPKASAAQ